MHKQLPVWQLIEQSLYNDTAVMLLYVLESNGSSPGRQGFAMCVNANGQMQGSIGGGIMEYKLVEMAREELKAVGKSIYHTQVKKQVHNKTATNNQSGMICSGEQTILLYQVKKTDTDTVKSIVESLQQNRNGLLRLRPYKLHFDGTVVPERDFYFNHELEDNWIYEEKTGYKNQLCIIGGGHCSLTLSRLMNTMDFYISLYDEREGLNTMQHNRHAHEKHIVDNYQNIAELVTDAPNKYVVVMTQGYRTDLIVIKALHGKHFKYVGLLGSTRKVDKLFNDLKNEGIDDDWISNIYTPVGLPVNSQTPEEIAVSIAAEIIAVKNAHNKNTL